eukprot:21049-Pleurochrysis_carterae.AAC.4
MGLATQVVARYNFVKRAHAVADAFAKCLLLSQHSLNSIRPELGCCSPCTQIYFTTFIGSSVISRQRVLQVCALWFVPRQQFRCESNKARRTWR